MPPSKGKHNDESQGYNDSDGTDHTYIHNKTSSLVCNGIKILFLSGDAHRAPAAIKNNGGNPSLWWGKALLFKKAGASDIPSCPAEK
jgi:hypothetical protein